MGWKGDGCGDRSSLVSLSVFSVSLTQMKGKNSRKQYQPCFLSKSLREEPWNVTPVATTGQLYLASLMGLWLGVSVSYCVGPHSVLLQSGPPGWRRFPPKTGATSLILKWKTRSHRVALVSTKMLTPASSWGPWESGSHPQPCTFKKINLTRSLRN